MDRKRRSEYKLCVPKRINNWSSIRSLKTNDRADPWIRKSESPNTSIHCRLWFYRSSESLEILPRDKAATWSLLCGLNQWYYWVWGGSVSRNRSWYQCRAESPWARSFYHESSRLSNRCSYRWLDNLPHNGAIQDVHE
jgi:hypothetical protein